MKSVFAHSSNAFFEGEQRLVDVRSFLPRDAIRTHRISTALVSSKIDEREHSMCSVFVSFSPWRDQRKLKYRVTSRGVRICGSLTRGTAAGTFAENADDVIDSVDDLIDESDSSGMRYERAPSVTTYLILPCLSSKIRNLCELFSRSKTLFA